MNGSTTISVGEQRGGNLDPNQPWWVKFIGQVGAWAALALALIAALLGWMPSPMMQRLERIEYNGWRSTQIQTAMCQNFAMNNKEKQMNCDPYPAWKQ